MQPPVVVASHQMQSAPIEPRDHELSLVETKVHVTRAQSGRAATNRQPEPPLILCLDGEEVPHDRFR